MQTDSKRRQLIKKKKIYENLKKRRKERSSDTKKERKIQRQRDTNKKEGVDHLESCKEGASHLTENSLSSVQTQGLTQRRHADTQTQKTHKTQRPEAAYS